MLTKLEVLGLRTLAPTLPLDEDGYAGSDPIQITGITGLEPVKAALTTTPFGAYDGAALVGASVGTRNIVISIGLNPDWITQTIDELRQLLYNYFMPKLLVRLRFTSDSLPVCQIDGYVESMTPNMFSKDPEIQVSIICPEPDFVAVDPTVVNGITNDGSDTMEIIYPGSVPAGFVLKVTKGAGDPGEDTLQVSLTGEYAPQIFVVSRSIIDDDIRFEMSTVRGEKYARSISLSLGTITNYLNYISSDSVWPVLNPNINKLAVITPVVGQNWELSYFARFGGL